jgi:hypothetical protein
MMLGPRVEEETSLITALIALRVVVALAVDLLGLRQQRLHALAQLHERVARVGLLDDAGDQLADAVAVLLEHHVALGLADPLQDHLLGGLRGDAAEVVRRDVADLDLVLEVAQAAGSMSGASGMMTSPVSGSTRRSSAPSACSSPRRAADPRAPRAGGTPRR